MLISNEHALWEAVAKADKGSFPSLTGDVALHAILNAIKATTGTTVLIGFSPMNGLVRTTVSISNDRATGRTLLTQLLQIVGPSSPLAWQMLTSPDSRYPDPGYFISIGSWVNQ
jgi:hypothetical protein